MPKNPNIYLTDKQYEELLDKVEEAVQVSTDFRVIDDTTPCNQSTTSQIGLCNDDFTTAENALFPDQFPNRKGTKYREQYHLCPFDDRLLKIIDGKHPGQLLNGCFWTCGLRKANQGREKLLERVGETKKLHRRGTLRRVAIKSNK